MIAPGPPGVDYRWRASRYQTTDRRSAFRDLCGSILDWLTWRVRVYAAGAQPLSQQSHNKNETDHDCLKHAHRQGQG